MTTAESVFRLLDDLPKSITSTVYYGVSKPLRHPDDPNKIIITTDFEDKSGIFELDLISNESALVHQYDKYKILPEGYGHFIHPQSKTLFIFGGTQSSFGAFNLETKKMKYENSNDLENYNNCPGACYIQSRNELHIIEHNAHDILRFISDNQIELIAEKAVNFEHDSFEDQNLLYIPSQQKLMTFCFSNGQLKIIGLDLMNKSAEWKQYHQIKFNGYVRNTYDVILGFANIVLIFDLNQLEIWCYHLLDNTSYKSNCKIPETMKYTGETYAGCNHPFVIQDDHNNAHIFDLSSGKHVQVDLFELIPRELLQSHRKYFQSLVIGYLRERENENNISCIPFVLKTLILKFLPL